MKVLLSGYYKEIVGCGVFKSREWGQIDRRERRRNAEENLPLSFLLFCQAVSFIFSLTVCKYLCIAVSLSLWLFKRGGKDTHPAAFAAAPDFFPLSSQEVSHLPLCWLSGEAQWCWNSGRCTHWLGSTLMHVEFYQHTRIHIHSHYKQSLISSDSDRQRYT